MATTSPLASPRAARPPAALSTRVFSSPYDVLAPVTPSTSATESSRPATSPSTCSVTVTLGIETSGYGLRKIMSAGCYLWRLSRNHPGEDVGLEQRDQADHGGSRDGVPPHRTEDRTERARP